MTNEKQNDHPYNPVRCRALSIKWSNGELTLEEKELLSTYLRSSHEARDLFLQVMQTDSNLRWKYSSKSQVESVLDYASKDGARPLAAIVEPQLAYRDDVDFASVYQRVSSQEEHAQLWLQMYPGVLSYVLFCVPNFSDSVGIVESIIGEVLSAYDSNESVDDFQKAITSSSRKLVHAYLKGDTGQVHDCYDLIADSCLGQNKEIEVAALYEASEQLIPHRLSSDALQILSLRYLQMLSLKQIASQLERSKNEVLKELAKYRILVWAACSDVDLKQVDPVQINHLVLANSLLDATSPSVKTLDRVALWLKASAANRKQFATFALLNESLHRQLSPKRLLEELATRKDDKFVEIVDRMVGDIERSSEPVIPPVLVVQERKETSLGRRRMVGWAVAASLLFVVGIGLLGKTGSDLPLQDKQTLAKVEVIESPVRKLLKEKVVIPVPLPPVVATITEWLPIGGADESSLAVGTLLRLNDEVIVEEGILSFETVSGHKIVLETPVSLLMQSKNEFLLRKGKFVGLNKTQSNKLTVNTPDVTVVDIGTEFGVAVLEGQPTMVAVYQGAVDLRQDDIDVSNPLRVDAGAQAIVSDGKLPDMTKPLQHERGFVRSDEVLLRKEAENGSADAAAVIDFYDLLRVDGLLAYHGFGADSNSETYCIGFKSPSIRPSAKLRYGPTLSSARLLDSISNSIIVTDGNSYLVDFDTSESSRLDSSGLLDEDGKIGSNPGELWLSWRSRTNLPDGEFFDWCGMSLMRGDARRVDEPLFIGQPSVIHNLGIHSNVFLQQDNLKFQLDADPDADGIQPIVADSSDNFWVAKLVFDGSKANIAIWLNVPLVEISSTEPLLKQELEQFGFDRLRFEATGKRDSGSCSFDEFVMATNLDAIKAVVNGFELKK